jgi:hypothetical protein
VERTRSTKSTTKRERYEGDLESPRTCWLLPLVFALSCSGIVSPSPVVFPRKGFPRKSRFPLLIWYFPCHMC